MKMSALIFGLFALVVSTSLPAEARNFYRGSINLDVTYSSISSGTQPVIQIPGITVSVSDDEKFCQLNFEGRTLSCFYQAIESWKAVNGTQCSSKLRAGPTDEGYDLYNCSHAPGILIPIDSVLKLLAGRIPAYLESNLKMKLMLRARDEKGRVRMDTFATRAFTESRRDVVNQLRYGTGTFEEAEMTYDKGEQIHDAVNPDSFHIRAQFSTPLRAY